MFTGFNPTNALVRLINSDKFTSSQVLNLVNLGADANIKDKDGRHLLTLLIERDDDATVKKLIENKKVNVALALDLPPAFHIPTDQLQPSTTKLGDGMHGNVVISNYNNTNVAVKTLTFIHQSYCVGLEDFKSEVDCLATLTNSFARNVVTLYGWNIEGTRLSIVLENIPLGTLEERILNKNNKMPDWDARIKISKGLVNGMEEIHKHFVFADLKAANVMLTQDMDVKIIDFGFAGPESMYASRGTPFTSAPEVLLGDFNTKISDIFSIGITLWEIVVWKLIYMVDVIPSTIDDGIQLATYWYSGRRPATSENTCSFIMEALINLCWSNKPGDRPPAKKLSKYLELPDNEVYEKIKNLLPSKLSMACRYAKMDLINQLISVEDINQIYQEGCTPLYLACANGHYDVAEKLISLGAEKNINHQDNNNTLLHAVTEAVNSSNLPRLIELLLAEGISIYAKNKDDMTAMDLAFKLRNDEAIICLFYTIKKMTLLTDSVMSSETLKRAKIWVAGSSLENEFNDDFFEKISLPSHLSDCYNRLTTLIKFCSNSTFQYASFSALDLSLAIHYAGTFNKSKSILDKAAQIYNLLCEPDGGEKFKLSVVKGIDAAVDVEASKTYFLNFIMKNRELIDTQLETREQVLDYLQSKSRLPGPQIKNVI